jgi:hypothetical protein
MNSLNDLLDPGLQPIAEVLLNLFPWINPEEDVYPRKSSLDDFLHPHPTFILHPTPRCLIRVYTCPGNVGILVWEIQGEVITTRRFVLNDFAEAVGTVSEALPQWMESQEFQTSSFGLFHLKGTIQNLPSTPRQLILSMEFDKEFKVLMSPSLGAFQVFSIPGYPWSAWSWCNPVDYLVWDMGKGHEIKPSQISVNHVLKKPKNLFSFTP